MDILQQHLSAGDAGLQWLSRIQKATGKQVTVKAGIGSGLPKLQCYCGPAALILQAWNITEEA